VLRNEWVKIELNDKSLWYIINKQLWAELASNFSDYFENLIVYGKKNYSTNNSSLSFKFQNIF